MNCHPLDHQGHGLGHAWLLLTLQSGVRVLTPDPGEPEGHPLGAALNRNPESPEGGMPPCSHLSAAQRTQLKLQAGCESPILRTFSRTTPLLQAGLYHTFFF